MIVSTVAAIAQEKWETFHPPADAFTIETPFDLSQRGENGKDDSRKYYASKGDTYLYVFSEPSHEAHQAATVEEFLKSQNRHLSVGKTLSSPLHFQDEFDYWHTIVSIDTGTRTFVVQAVSLDEDSTIAERFVSTFKLGSPGEPNSPVGPPTAPAAAGPLQLLKPDVAGPGSGTGIGSGSGAGFGTGTASGIGTGGVPPPPPMGSRALRIVTKPRAGYTDFARMYEINGTVVLKVSFLESGQVGVVRTVKGLPFGLSTQATIAAKHIKFEPELKDGQPVSITKQVEYNFSIY